MRFAVDLLIFEMAENWKVLVTSFKTLLICWFVELLSCWAVELLSCWVVELLSCWAVELLSCWAVDLLSHLLIIFLMVVLDPKIQSYRSQNTVELLIFLGAGSKSRRLNSALSCWFVDFLKDSLWKTQNIRVNGRKTLLIRWFYNGFLLSVWVLIVHFPVDLLIFEMAPYKELKNLS